MLKCYITEIELNSETAYVLDIAKAMHIMRALKSKELGLVYLQGTGMNISVNLQLKLAEFNIQLFLRQQPERL